MNSVRFILFRPSRASLPSLFCALVKRNSLACLALRTLRKNTRVGGASCPPISARLPARGARAVRKPALSPHSQVAKSSARTANAARARRASSARKSGVKLHLSCSLRKLLTPSESDCCPTLTSKYPGIKLLQKRGEGGFLMTKVERKPLATAAAREPESFDSASLRSLSFRPRRRFAHPPSEGPCGH
jgi:hypothetical protein